jgi:hypothetical protein
MFKFTIAFAMFLAWGAVRMVDNLMVSGAMAGGL